MYRLIFCFLLFPVLVFSQTGQKEKLIYQSDFYSLYNNKVVQGDNTAVVVSPSMIRSNYKNKDGVEREWKLSKDISGLPSYKSDQLVVDALFNLSTEESLKNIESDSTFRTGAKWGGVWTRDISFSIILAFAYLQPEVAKISLMKKVKRGRIIQDTGSGGAWPVSSDRMIWAVAAWEIYKTTGDEKWLKQIYPIIKNSLADDRQTLFDSATSLYRGESSFLDWREQTYPRWMSNMDIYVSENLATNIVHYTANSVFVEMSKLLHQPFKIYQERADVLKQGINKQFWVKEKGYYGQYLYGRPYLTLSPRFEALGEALSIFFNVADNAKATSLLSRSPVTPFGVSCIYPQIPGIPPYHNNAVWPFVQSYWNLAAAKAGNEKALVQGLSSIYRAGALFLTNYENFVADNGDFNGTQINSDRMLWSMAGNLAMVYRVFMGMSFKTNGLSFAPVIPKVFGGTRTLSRFKYRNALLDITVQGWGRKAKSMKMDGKVLRSSFIPATIKGKHSVVIEMDNQSFDRDALHIVSNHFSLASPVARQTGNKIEWDKVESGAYYNVYRNDHFVEKTNRTEFDVDSTKTATYKVSVVDKDGWESFTSEPVLIAAGKNIAVVEMENFAGKALRQFTNFTGSGFAEFSTTSNRDVTVNCNVAKEGRYMVDFRYSNGSGPWNTENKCAIRSLFANGRYLGAVVFPQRGTDAWSDWSYSNSYFVNLKKGVSTFRIKFEDWNNNMNVDVNTMMLDNLRLIYVN